MHTFYLIFSLYIFKRLQFILDSGAVHYEGFAKFIVTKQQNPLSSLVSLRNIAANLVVRMGVNLEETPSVQRLVGEMELFLSKGNLEPKHYKVVCLNPTLLTLDDKVWQVRRKILQYFSQLLKLFYLFLFLDFFSY